MRRRRNAGLARQRQERNEARKVFRVNLAASNAGNRPVAALVGYLQEFEEKHA